jgi:hypothetical protein
MKDEMDSKHEIVSKELQVLKRIANNISIQQELSAPEEFIQTFVHQNKLKKMSLAMLKQKELGEKG